MPIQKKSLAPRTPLGEWPSSHLDYSGFKAVLRLRPSEKPSERSFFDVLESRRSAREFNRVALSLDSLSDLIYFGSRIKKTYSDPAFGNLSFRPSPSCGARHAIETLIYAQNVSGLERDVYGLNAEKLSLHRLGLDHSTFDVIENEILAASYPRFNRCPQLVLIFIGILERMEVGYGDWAYSQILKDLGALTQTQYLVAEALGLGACALGVEGTATLTLSLKLEEGEALVGAMAIGSRL